MNDDLFSGFEPPPLPPGLEKRVLDAARAAFADPTRPDVWTRLIRSRTARLAWAASVLLLLGLHAAIPGRRAGPHQAVPTAAAPRPDPEMTAIVTLPRIDERAATARTGGPS